MVLHAGNEINLHSIIASSGVPTRTKNKNIQTDKSLKCHSLKLRKHFSAE